MTMPNIIDLDLAAHERETIERAADFARNYIAPQCEAWEAARLVPRSAFAEAARLGLTLVLPHGDHFEGMVSHAGAGRIAEELAAGSLTFALPIIAQNYVAWSLLQGGDGKFASVVAAMRSGTTIGAFSLTEPDVGSDAGALRTTARKVDGGWRLSGEKAWVTRGVDADFYIVFAQTGDAGTTDGIALFFIEKGARGLKLTPQYDLVGANSLGVCGIKLDAVTVPPENMLIAPGQAYRFALKAIDFARAYVASMSCGILRSCLEGAIDYTKERGAFNRKIIDFQGIQWKLADVWTELEAARLLADNAIALLARGKDGKIPVAHAKKYATRAALNGLDACIQVMGANGVKAGNAVSRHHASVKIIQYLDGPSEIQNVLISRRLSSFQASIEA